MDSEANEFNESIYPECQMTVESSALLMRSFVLKHKLTTKATSELLHLVAAHFPVKRKDSPLCKGYYNTHGTNHSRCINAIGLLL